jgi:hypothetical protein
LILRTFAAQHNRHLGWYGSRRLTIDPGRDDPRLVRLAAFVDYDKTSDNETVLVKIMDSVYLQYNRAKGINRGTGEKRNQVIITQEREDGTETLAGLLVGESFTIPAGSKGEKEVVIEACDKVPGERRGPDVMVVGITRGSSLCTSGHPVSARSNQPEHSNAIILRPKAAPNTSRPSLRRPSLIPTVAPTLNPTSTAPVRHPSSTPTDHPSASPTSSCGGLGAICDGTLPVRKQTFVPSREKDFPIGLAARTPPPHHKPLLQILFAAAPVSPRPPPSLVGSSHRPPLSRDDDHKTHAPSSTPPAPPTRQNGDDDDAHAFRNSSLTEISGNNKEIANDVHTDTVRLPWESSRRGVDSSEGMNLSLVFGEDSASQIPSVGAFPLPVSSLAARRRLGSTLQRLLVVVGAGLFCAP